MLKHFPDDPVVAHTADLRTTCVTHSGRRTPAGHIGGIVEALASMLHRYPFFAGCGRLANGFVLRRLTESISKLQWARTRRGQELLVDPSDFVGRAAYLFGTLDPKIDWISESILRPGDSFVDIGANIGQVTLVASRRVGSRGHVHSVEPQPEVAHMLRRTLARNSVSNVSVHEVALSESEGRVWLSVPEGNRGMGSLTDSGAGSVRVEVRSTRPDQFFASLPSPVRMVKIDVEGHEETILARSEPFIRRCRPACVLFECRDFSSFWERPGIRVLQNQGYRFFGLRGFLRPGLTRLHFGTKIVNGLHDVVALSEEGEAAVNSRISR